MEKNKGNRVLCIGNDPVSLNLRGSLLQQHGWTVSSAGSGHQGTLLFSQESADAVVIDLNHDGSESALIIAELRRQKPDVPIVLLVPAHHNLANGATQQATSVVVKTQGDAGLLEALRRVLPTT